MSTGVPECQKIKKRPKGWVIDQYGPERFDATWLEMVKNHFSNCHSNVLRASMPINGGRNFRPVKTGEEKRASVLFVTLFYTASTHM